MVGQLLFGRNGKGPGGMARILIAGVVLVGIAILINKPGKTPVPAIFEPGITLAQAETLSAETGRPVLAFVTADWCPPCQQLKRNALVDESVAQWIRENTHPVYIDVSTSSTPEAERVEAKFLPTLALMRGGQVVSRTTGALSSEQLLEFLAANSGPVADQKAREPR